MRNLLSLATLFSLVVTFSSHSYAFQCNYMLSSAHSARLNAITRHTSHLSWGNVQKGYIIRKNLQKYRISSLFHESTLPGTTATVFELQPAFEASEYDIEKVSDIVMQVTNTY